MYWHVNVAVRQQPIQIHGHIFFNLFKIGNVERRTHHLQSNAKVFLQFVACTLAVAFAVLAIALAVATG